VSLRHANAVLKSELERLQMENAELKAKLVMSAEAANL
jgi:type II pantothenate kinase